jgi:hypothetical protein
MYVYKFTTNSPRKPWSVGLNTDNGFLVLCYCASEDAAERVCERLTAAVRCPN